MTLAELLHGAEKRSTYHNRNSATIYFDLKNMNLIFP